MSDIVQIVVITLTQGATIGLIALGINIVFATTRIVNFAQGGIVVAAGYLAFQLSDPARFGLPIWVAFAIVMVLGAVLGVLTDLIAVAPLGRFDPATNIGWIITTFALGTLFIPDVVKNSIGADPQKIPNLVSGKAIRIAAVAITPSDILLIVFAVGLMVGIELLLTKTMLGRAFSAVSQDRTTASLMGINTGFIVILSFGIAGLLGAVGAILIAPTLFVKLDNSITLSFAALIAAVFGGLGSTRGAIFGAFSVAFIQGLTTTLIPNGGRYADLVIFAGLLAVLALKPSGIFGKVQIEKV